MQLSFRCFTWWEFWPRKKKKDSPPPPSQIPRKHPPSPSPPRPTALETPPPPAPGIFDKNRPPPLPVPQAPLSPPPSRKKEKISETSTKFMTLQDASGRSTVLWRFMSSEERDGICHEMLQMKCCKVSRDVSKSPHKCCKLPQSVVLAITVSFGFHRIRWGAWRGADLWPSQDKKQGFVCCRSSLTLCAPTTNQASPASSLGSQHPSPNVKNL